MGLGSGDIIAGTAGHQAASITGGAATSTDRRVRAAGAPGSSSDLQVLMADDQVNAVIAETMPKPVALTEPPIDAVLNSLVYCSLCGESTSVKRARIKNKGVGICKCGACDAVLTQVNRGFGKGHVGVLTRDGLAGVKEFMARCKGLSQKEVVATFRRRNSSARSKMKGTN